MQLIQVSIGAPSGCTIRQMAELMRVRINQWPQPTNHEIGYPLLVIAWRHPHTLRQVIDAIRPVAPTRLNVACDGPNPERCGKAEGDRANRRWSSR